MRILFSPIGTADPISALGDGPMLHIVRHYVPEKIVLFFSPKMLEYQRRDEHFTEAIKLLCESMERVVPEIEIVESGIEGVHRYDLHIKEFEDALRSLRENNPEAEILVNVTSGTPAMEAALVAIDAFGRYNLQAIQVETPRKGPNKTGDRADHANYDLATYWECDEDGSPNAENRCREIQSANFADLILRDNIRALVKKYDYVGAWALAKDCTSLSEEASKLIEGSVFRMMLDQQRAAECFKKTKLPGPGPKLHEYLAMLEVYLAREQWADYLRAMTPALFETCFRQVRKHVRDEAWTTVNRRGVRKVDPGLVSADSQLSEALGLCVSQPVNSSFLCALIDYFDSRQVAGPYLALRQMEDCARNVVAHEMTRIDRDKIERDAGISFEESLNLLFDLNSAGSARGLYSRINERILELL